MLLLMELQDTLTDFRKYVDQFSTWAREELDINISKNIYRKGGEESDVLERWEPKEVNKAFGVAFPLVHTADLLEETAEKLRSEAKLLTTSQA